MNIKRMFLVLIVVAIFSALAINTSFAVSNEKLSSSQSVDINSYSKKIVNFDTVYKHSKYKDENYYKISIKKFYRYNYKIKSGTVKFGIMTLFIKLMMEKISIG